MKASEIKLSYKRKSTGIIITSSKDVESVLRNYWNEDSLDYFESFVVIYLSRKNEVLGVMKISDGSIEACIVDPRRIFQGALLTNSSSIILAHNHPSGNLKPSSNDIKITNQIKEGSELLKIKVLDHVILTTESYFSFADDGMI